MAGTEQLQFLLLPIRDWNVNAPKAAEQSVQHCNFYYSLLGIETWIKIMVHPLLIIAISITPY